jgi:hypothetical protein
MKREPLAGPAPLNGDGDGSELGEAMATVLLGVLFAPLVLWRTLRRLLWRRPSATRARS